MVPDGAVRDAELVPNSVDGHTAGIEVGDCAARLRRERVASAEFLALRSGAVEAGLGAKKNKGVIVLYSAERAKKQNDPFSPLFPAVFCCPLWTSQQVIRWLR